MPDPLIRTARLTLRPPRLTDADAIFRGYAQDPEVCRYLHWPPHTSVQVTEAFLREAVATLPSDKSYPWVITVIPHDVPIGMIELRPHNSVSTVGYVLKRSEWGKGYATEALRAVIAYAFAREDLYRVAALCDIDNRASVRVMEKAGMRREGVLHRFMRHNASDVPRDVFIYALTR